MNLFYAVNLYIRVSTRMTGLCSTDPGRVNPEHFRAGRVGKKLRLPQMAGCEGCNDCGMTV